MKTAHLPAAISTSHVKFVSWTMCGWCDEGKYCFNNTGMITKDCLCWWVLGQLLLTWTSEEAPKLDNSGDLESLNEVEESIQEEIGTLWRNLLWSKPMNPITWVSFYWWAVRNRWESATNENDSNESSTETIWKEWTALKGGTSTIEYQTVQALIEYEWPRNILLTVIVHPLLWVI